MKAATSRLLRRIGLAAACALGAGGAAGYEADVHAGLTQWLALQAGFDASQAEALATADQRVDGGMLEMTELALEYGCAARLPGPALQAQQARYPSAVSVPAPAPARAVVPGGEAARAALRALAPRLPGKEGLMVGKFGEALHPLQDSWSHAGVPEPVALAPTLDCDAALTGGHPALRGGAASHAADLTARYPADTLAMAHATYDALVAYPPIQGRVRKAAAWESLAPAVDAFARAATKRAKREWFSARGIADTGFLGGISLPDGGAPGVPAWRGWRLLPLPGDDSRQHDADPAARRFFDQLLARWVGSESIETVVGALGPGRGTPAGRELATRLALWKLRDHGAAADLVHAPAPLGATQRRAAERLTAAKGAFIEARSIADAVFSLQPSGRGVQPLVPYIALPLPAGPRGARWLAILRFRHAPYDTVGLIAEGAGDAWKLVDVVAVVDE